MHQFLEFSMECVCVFMCVYVTYVHHFQGKVLLALLYVRTPYCDCCRAWTSSIVLALVGAVVRSSSSGASLF